MAPERKKGHTTWGRQRRHHRQESLCQAKETAPGPIILCDCVAHLFCSVLVRLDKGPVFREEVRGKR